jgi:transcriptional regulator with XRE-family HTH domain
MLSINISTPDSVMKNLCKRFQDKRLEFDLTQEGLASKSGVSLGSIKRFETSGKISLESLLKISLVLDCLNGFQHIAKKNEEKYSSIKELLKEKKSKKRGTIK